MEKVLERIMRGVEQAKNAPTENTYKCRKCRDTEFIFKTNERGQEYAVRCECFERNQALRFLKNSGISEEDATKGFGSFETFNETGLVTAKAKALDYFKSFETMQNNRINSLLLCGASGRGKTTLGMAVANNLIKKCIYVRYMPYREEVTQLKQEITDDRAYKEHIHKLKTARVLFIDDLLKGKVTESDVNIVYEIINARYLAKLPTIISTELMPNELMDFDEAIGGRIMEMCKGYVVPFDKSIQNYRLR